MANLKFFRKAVAPTEGLVAGAIWFNTTDRTIQIYTGAQWEKYTGLVDATYVDNVLTLTKSIGDPIVLDFTNVAKADALAALQTEVDTLEGNVNANGAAITALQTTVGEHTTALGTVDSRIEAAVDAEEERALAAEEALAGRVSTLETAKTEQAGKIATLETAVNTTIPGQISDLEAADDALEARVLANENKLKGVDVVKTYVDNAISGVNEALATEATTARAAEKANADAIDVVEAAVATLIGNIEGDNAKSVRTISAEEVAKIVDGADASYDTLKEIADWIAAHPESVAEINTAIGNNAKAIQANAEAIDAIEAAYVKSVADSADYLEVTTADGVVTIADATLKAKIAEMVEDIQDNADAILEVTNKAGVTSIQNATGAITLDVDNATNGNVKFAIANNKISAVVNGLQDAAYVTVASLNTTAQGYANTAKSEAVSAAASDATTKANNAVASAKSYTDSAITAALVWAEF